MKILTAEQLSKADQATLKAQNITSEELMERAATLVFDEINNRLQGAQIPIKVFCGIGNNGGDGLVVARHLIQHGYNVTIFIVNYSDKRTENFLSNYEKLKEITNDWPEFIKDEGDFPEIQTGDFVIDAIFGIGLNRPVEGWLKKFMKTINDSGAFVLSIDMPSGLFADKATPKKSGIIKAEYTLSFQSPKIVFFLPDAIDYVGDLQVLDIGLDRGFIANLKQDTFLIGKEEALKLYRPRKKNSHKNDYGHSLIVGGSYGKMGSVLLTATAALRSGAGLASLFIPKCGYQIIQTGLPEAMVLTDDKEDKLTGFPKDFKSDVICFGMGAGTDKETLESLKQALSTSENPMLIDADGLNFIAKNEELLKMIPENSVLTPHPGELKRLIGDWKNDFEKIEKVKKFSKKYKIILVVKDAHSLTVNRDEIYINSSGNPGMATAGSGDVLSGVITALISQKYNPVAAAVLGVYLHGISGDLMVEQHGYQGILAGDIAGNMGRAFRYLLTPPQSPNVPTPNEK